MNDNTFKIEEQQAGQQSPFNALAMAAQRAQLKEAADLPAHFVNNFLVLGSGRDMVRMVFAEQMTPELPPVPRFAALMQVQVLRDIIKNCSIMLDRMEEANAAADAAISAAEQAPKETIQ